MWFTATLKNREILLFYTSVLSLLVGSGNETDSDGSVPELEEPNGTMLRPSNPPVR